MYITIIREISPLNREEWQFWYFDKEHTIRCRSYCKQTRPSTRHKFRTIDSYDSHMRRDCTLTTPPLPDDVRVRGCDVDAS